MGTKQAASGTTGSHLACISSGATANFPPRAPGFVPATTPGLPNFSLDETEATNLADFGSSFAIVRIDAGAGAAPHETFLRPSILKMLGGRRPLTRVKRSVVEVNFLLEDETSESARRAWLAGFAIAQLLGLDGREAVTVAIGNITDDDHQAFQSWDTPV